MSVESFIYGGIAFFILGASSSLLPFGRAKAPAYTFAAIGSLCLAAAGLGLISGAPREIYSAPISSLFEFKFSGDALSGFFVLVVSIVAFAASVYSVGYTKGSENRGLLGFLFSTFILSIYAVVLSANVVTFLISWETMSVVSYFLVTFDRSEKSARAGLVYAVMTHVGTAFIILLFLVLYGQTGSMDFAGMKELAAAMPGNLRHLVFVFALIGFGTKAGIIPLHTWLPMAHPAAPSNISALMSGVMIKTGIYGFVRIAVDVLGQGPEWWGIAVLVVGAVSAVLGVMYALIEHDLKRLLAYSSIENIGIILLGVGAAMTFRSHGLYALSAIALVAGLYHTLNHALFKGLLFLGAGSVVHATHTRNMEDMGGLIKAMPYTAFLFLVGSVSICALPPFNGFVSEWLTYQSLLLGFKSPSVVSKIVSPLGGAALALTGALAAACFVKAFGISFLGAPRSHHAESAKEQSPYMTAGMAVLALLCLLSGIFPGAVISLLSPSALLMTGSEVAAPTGGFLYIDEAASSVSPAFMLVTMAVMAAAAGVFALAVGGRRKKTFRDSWDCGMRALTPRMQYTATAFAKPVRMIFKRIYLPKRELKISYIVKPFFVKSMEYSGEITPFFENYFYRPLLRLVHGIAGRVKLLQSGSLHLYLGYMLITLMALLMAGT